MDASFDHYSQTLFHLSQHLGLTYSAMKWNNLIDQKLEGTNISRLMPVATWVIDFFTCFTDKLEVDNVSFDAPDRGLLQDDRWISLASVLLPGTWKDEGEYRSVAFDSLRFEGYIMYEGNFYTVNRY